MRTRVKRSVVWKISDTEFSELVKKSVSVGDICRKLSGRKGGSVFKNIKHRIETLHLSTNHFIDGRRGTYSPVYVSEQEFRRRLDAKEPMDPNWMKRKLLEFSILKNECSECGVSNVWKGKPLTLILDHVDGDFTNNIISNFRILCPNCNSQTPTFSMGKRVRKSYQCSDCKRSTSGYGVRCLKCACLEREKQRKMVGNTGIEPVNQECHSCSLPLA